MSAVAAVQLDSAQRLGRSLDAIWILALLTVFAVIFLAWFLRALDVDLGRIAWTIAAVTALQHAVALIAARLASQRALDVARAANQLAGVLGIGVLWHLCGAWHNPAFIAFFAAAIVAAGMGGERWQISGTVVCAVLAVLIVSVANSPVLRWYLAQTGVPVGLVEACVWLLPAAVAPYPELSLPLAHQWMALATFAVAASAIGFIVAELSAAVERPAMCQRELLERAEESERLAQALIAGAQAPSVLLEAASGQIVLASDGLAASFPGAAPGTRLADSVRFSDPDLIERQLEDGAGSSLQLIGAPGEAKPARVCVRVVSRTQSGTRALLSFIPLDHYELAAALDLCGDPLILVDSQRHIGWLNGAARALFPAAAPGAAAGEALDRDGLPNDWWSPGRRERTEFNVGIAGRLYRIICASGKAQGLAGRFVLLHFMAAERSET